MQRLSRPCRERHLYRSSYAAFRLSIFRQLWCGKNDVAPRHSTLQRHRPFHTTGPDLKHGRGPNTVKNSRRQQAIIRRVASEVRKREKEEGEKKDGLVVIRAHRKSLDSYSYSYFRPSGVRQELLRARRKGAVKDGAGVKSNTIGIVRDESDTASDPSVLRSSETGVAKEIDRPDDLGDEGQTDLQGGGVDNRVWNPYTEKGNADVAALMAELEVLTKQAITKPRTLVERAEEAAEAGQQAVVIPIRSFSSPIERRIEHQEKRKQPKQQLAIEDRNSPMYRNPWARILASSVRHDQGTKARLPKSLMTTWGMIRNPEDSRDHLMPIELSNLQVLREWIDYVEIVGTPTHQNLETFQKPPEGERVYIQPNAALVQAITKEVLKKPSGTRAKTHVASSLLTTTLIPWRWSEAINRADTYRKTQTVVDPVTGEEKVDNKWREHVAKLSSLQWQPDIDTRLRLIFSERILTTLEGVVRTNSTAKGIRAKRVYAMDIPNNGRLVLDAQHIVADAEVSCETNNQVASQGAHDEKLPTWLSGSYFLHVGTPQQYVDTVKKWRQQQRQSPSYSATERSQEISATEKLPDLPDNDYIPPTITVGSSTRHTSSSISRLPIFNLPALLGPSFTDRLEQLVHQREHRIMDHQFWTDYDTNKDEYLANKAASRIDQPNAEGDEASSTVEPQTKDIEIGRAESMMTPSSNEQEDIQLSDSISNNNIAHKEYVVLIKGNAAKGHTLLTELWQLWRYIGGRDGLWHGGGDDKNHTTEGVVSPS